MDKFDINSLLEKYLNGRSTPNENAVLETWYMRYENKNLADIAEEARIEQLDRIRLQVAQYSMPDKPDVIKRMISTWRLLEIAAAVAVVVFGVWVYTSGPVVNPNAEVVTQNDIAPGKNGATITLANGEVIQLSNAKSGVVIGDDKLAYNDKTAIVIDPSSRGKESALGHANSRDLSSLRSVKMTAQTSKGQTYQFTLPDGTKVWLNADSKLEFSSNLSKGNTRIVKLQGEAYFEVSKVLMKEQGLRSKEKRLPFIVMSNGQQVEVLGTHFNVNAYADEGNTKTTLLEGLVQVTSQQKPGDVIGKGFSEVLKPGQQTVLTANKLDVITASIEQSIAWKNGQFAFEKQSLQEIMRCLSRWYDVEVVFEPGFKSMPFTGSVSRFKNISTVLNLLELTGKVHFRIEGRRVTVMK
jgi:transmembrane sensor